MSEIKCSRCNVKHSPAMQCKHDDLYARIKELEAKENIVTVDGLSVGYHMIVSYRKQIEELEAENEIYKKVNAEQLKYVKRKLEADKELSSLRNQIQAVNKLLDDSAVVNHSSIRACFTVDGDGMHFDPDMVAVEGEEG